MTIKLSTGLRNLMAASNGISGAFADGVIYIYSGPQPATADAAVSGTLLGIVTKDAGAFVFGTATNGLTWGAAAAGVVAKSADNWQFNGLDAGTAGWFRLMGNPIDNLALSTTLPRVDGSIGVTGADLNMSNIAIALAAPNTIDAFALTVPAQS